VDAVRLGIAALMFLGAILSDLRTRRVPNRYWVPFLAAGLVLALRDLGHGGLPWSGVAWAAGTCAFLYALWWLGLFGGADAKGLMVLAVLWPAAPDLYAARTTPTVDALMDGTLLMLALPVAFFVWNAAHRDVAFPAMLLGVRTDLRRAWDRHVWPLQQVRDGRVVWRFRHRPGQGADHAALHRAGLDRVWVTPKIPFMLPLGVGLLLAAWKGNLILALMAALLAG